MRVAEHRPPPSPRSKAPFKVLVEDDTGDVELVFFLANLEWIKKRLPVGATRWVSGKLELWDGHLQMVHPDQVMDAEELAQDAGGRAGLWPDRRALSAHRREGGAGRAGAAAALPEWIDEATLRRLKAPAFADALRAMHSPSAPGDVDPDGPAATRLAYDELLANQLALLMVRARMRDVAGRAHVSAGRAGADASSTRCRSR